MLCIDVSGSMDGKPIREAVRGAKKFVSEAVEARYKVGVMLWNTQVTDLAEPTSDGKGAMKLLRPDERRRRRQRSSSARLTAVTRSLTSSRMRPTGWWRCSATGPSPLRTRCCRK